jgi:hypothetical protein
MSIPLALLALVQKLSHCYYEGIAPIGCNRPRVSAICHHSTILAFTRRAAAIADIENDLPIATAP